MQRGQAILFTVLLLLMVTVFGVYSLVAPGNTQVEIDRKTDSVLVQAREALIAYAVANAAQPGRFFCPDTTNSGTPGSCSAAGAASNRLARLPWKSLLVPDLRDGYGERLWYAVSANFLGNGMINSDTTGEYTVTGTMAANNIVAVIFSPGPPIGVQKRDSTLAICSTTGTSIARNNCATNYLDAGNNDGDTTFNALPLSINFNDRFVVITQETLIQRVIPRVTGEARKVLNRYYLGHGLLAANNHFPYASAFNDDTRECTNGVLQGRVPAPGVKITTLPCKNKAKWPNYEPWFDENRWGNYLFYAVSSACTNDATAASCIASGGLTVSGISTNVQALIIATGRAFTTTGQVRPCVTANDCLEDSENSNSDTVFVRPSLSSTNNDQLLIVAP
jgi:hypothetical protein